MFGEWLLFALKFLTALVFILLLLVLPLLLAKAARGPRSADGDDAGSLCVENLFEKQEERLKFMRTALKKYARDPQIRAQKEKRLHGYKKKVHKEQEFSEREDQLKQKEAAGEFCPRNLYVLNFKGDLKAAGVAGLRHEIDALTAFLSEKDEVILCLNSSGGMVNAYGLAASELTRLKKPGAKLTVCVDTVAASGGYMMAAVADRIVAAPFAYVGSIGVIAQLPNFSRFLESHDVDYEQITAGRYKRTLTLFGKNTEEGREKFRQELEAVHRRFKEEVQKFRPQLDMEKVATGEAWLASDAMELGLVDEIAVSSEYIARRMELTHGCALKLSWQSNAKKTLRERLHKLLSARTWLKNLKKLADEQSASGARAQIK